MLCINIEQVCALSTHTTVFCCHDARHAVSCHAVSCCLLLCCSVVSIEPVPIFRAFMEYSAARNHLTTNMEIIPAVVALNTTQTYTINAPLIKGVWGS